MDGKLCEPFEEAIVDVPEQYVGGCVEVGLFCMAENSMAFLRTESGGL